MKKIISGIVSLFVVAFAASAQQPADTIRLTLEECLDYAFGNSYSRQATVLNEEAQDDLYDQSKMERLPSLSGSLGENFTHTDGSSGSWNGTYSLSTGMTLYQGGNINQTIKQSELRAEQTRYRTAQYDNELTIQILQAFLTVLGNEELLKYQQSVLDASLEQVNQGEQRYNAGTILESDYLLLRAQYATDRNNIVETGISRENSLSTLKSLLSIDPQQPLEVIYPDTAAVRSMLLLPSESYVLESSMASLPDLKISQYNVDIAETGLKISRSSYFPTVSLSGSIGTGHQKDFSNYSSQLSDRFNQQAGISVSIPIFNRNRTRSNVNQSRIALQQAELDDMQAQLDIRQSVLQEYRDVVGAVSKFESSEIKQDAYLKSFEAYRAKYDAGAITTVELLQQQNNYINAMNDYIQSKYGFLLKRKILDVYMGEPVTM